MIVVVILTFILFMAAVGIFVYHTIMGPVVRFEDSCSFGDCPYVKTDGNDRVVNIELFISDMEAIKRYKLYELNWFRARAFEERSYGFSYSLMTLAQYLKQVEVNYYSKVNDCRTTEALKVIEDYWAKKRIDDKFEELKQLYTDSIKNRLNKKYE